MRGVVKVPAFSGLFLLFSLFTGLPSHGAAPQLDLLGQWPEETRGQYHNAAAEGGFLTVAAGSGGVQMFDLRNPAAPIRAGELYGLPDEPMVIARDGDRALALGWNGWMASLDLSNPAAPAVLWETNRHVRVSFPAAAVSGQLAVVTGTQHPPGENIAEVWNLGDPARPERISSLPLGLHSAGINLTFDGTNAFLAVFSSSGSPRFMRIDVSQPAAPVASLVVTNSSVWDVLSRSGNRLLINSSSRPSLWDVNDPAAPVLLSTNLTATGGIHAGLLEGNLAYLAEVNTFPSNVANLHIVDVSNPAQPVTLGTAPLKATTVAGVRRVGPTAVALVTWQDGIQVYDVADPAQPRLTSTIGSAGHAVRVEPNGAAAYVADGHALRVLDVTAPQIPALLSPVAGVSTRAVQDIARYGTNLVVVGESRRHDVISIANPTAPAFVRSYLPSGIDPGVSVAVLDNGLFLVGRNVPSRQVDVFYAGGGQAYWFQPQPYSFAPAIIGRGFTFLNPVVARGTNLTVLGEMIGQYRSVANLGLPSAPSAVAGDGPLGRAYVVGGTNGLLVVDVSVPAQPRLIGTNFTRGPARGVTVRWPYVFVAEGFEGVEVFDATNPTNLVAIAHFDTRGEAESVSLEGDRVYVADGARGVTILRWASGRQPQTITPPPLLTRVTNSPPFALTATASSGLPVSVRILEGPLAADGDVFRTTNAAFFSTRETNKVVRLRFETPGSDSYEPAYLDASFDVIRQPSASDKYGNWILANHPEFSTAQMHWRADPDGDGAGNEQEFVFGGNPAEANATDGRLSPPRIEFDGTRWVMRFAITVNPAYTTGPQRVTPQAADTASGPWYTLPASQYRFEGSQLLVTLPLSGVDMARFVRVRL